jgi:hypothetical protein
MTKRSAKDDKKWPRIWVNARAIGYDYREAGDHELKKRPAIVAKLLDLIQGDVAGDPISGQQWVRRSLSKIRQALLEAGYRLAQNTIRRLLRDHNIRPKSNRKRLKTNPNPDRDQQFNYIQRQRQVFDALEQPMISVDTKKKELIGLFHNAGQVWCEQAPSVNMYDFPSMASGKAVPYGIYDMQFNEGYVYVGQSADTPEFAVDAIVAWWQTTGRQHYPDATDLLILADGGGSNGYRPRRWKQQLQVKLVDAFGLTVTVAHYPPGASKWNPIEHRLFSQISQTWAGTPLISFDTVVDAIHATTTSTGLTVDATLGEQVYQTGITVSDEEMASLALERHITCPKWNYTLYPRKTGDCF